MTNPRAKPEKVLGFTVGQWTAARAQLLNFLDAADNLQDVNEAAARATHPLFADSRAWAQMRAEVGIE